MLTPFLQAIILGYRKARPSLAAKSEMQSLQMGGAPDTPDRASTEARLGCHLSRSSSTETAAP